MGVTTAVDEMIVVSQHYVGLKMNGQHQEECIDKFIYEIWSLSIISSVDGYNSSCHQIIVFLTLRRSIVVSFTFGGPLSSHGIQLELNSEYHWTPN